MKQRNRYLRGDGAAIDYELVIEYGGRHLGYLEDFVVDYL